MSEYYNLEYLLSFIYDLYFGYFEKDKNKLKLDNENYIQEVIIYLKKCNKHFSDIDDNNFKELFKKYNINDYYKFLDNIKYNDIKIICNESHYLNINKNNDCIILDENNKITIKLNYRINDFKIYNAFLWYTIYLRNKIQIKINYYLEPNDLLYYITQFKIFEDSWNELYNIEKISINELYIRYSNVEQNNKILYNNINKSILIDNLINKIIKININDLLNDNKIINFLKYYLTYYICNNTLNIVKYDIIIDSKYLTYNKFIKKYKEIFNNNFNYELSLINIIKNINLNILKYDIYDKLFTNNIYENLCDSYTEIFTNENEIIHFNYKHEIFNLNKNKRQKLFNIFKENDYSYKGFIINLIQLYNYIIDNYKENNEIKINNTNLN